MSKLANRIQARVIDVDTHSDQLVLQRQTNQTTNDCCGGFCGSQLNPLSAQAQPIFKVSLQSLKQTNQFESVTVGDVIQLHLAYPLWLFQGLLWLLATLLFLLSLSLLGNTISALLASLLVTLTGLLLMPQLLIWLKVHPNQFIYVSYNQQDAETQSRQ